MGVNIIGELPIRESVIKDLNRVKDQSKASFFNLADLQTNQVISLFEKLGPNTDMNKIFISLLNEVAGKAVTADLYNKFDQILESSAIKAVKEIDASVKWNWSKGSFFDVSLLDIVKVTKYAVQRFKELMDEYKETDKVDKTIVDKLVAVYRLVVKLDRDIAFFEEQSFVDVPIKELDQSQYTKIKVNFLRFLENLVKAVMVLNTTWFFIMVVQLMTPELFLVSAPFISLLFPLWVVFVASRIMTRLSHTAVDLVNSIVIPAVTKLRSDEDIRRLKPLRILVDGLYLYLRLDDYTVSEKLFNVGYNIDLKECVMSIMEAEDDDEEENKNAPAVDVVEEEPQDETDDDTDNNENDNPENSEEDTGLSFDDGEDLGVDDPNDSDFRSAKKFEVFVNSVYELNDRIVNYFNDLTNDDLYRVISTNEKHPKWTIINELYRELNTLVDNTAILKEECTSFENHQTLALRLARVTLAFKALDERISELLVHEYNTNKS